MGAERELALAAERDQHKATAAALLAILADIRMACGDNGKRMQPELVEFIGVMSAERDRLKIDLHIATDDAAQMLASTQALRAERDQLRAEVERLRPNAERYIYLRDVRHNLVPHDSLIGLWVFSRPTATASAFDTAIDLARTTHKDTP